MAYIFVYTLGKLCQSSLRTQRDFGRDMDVASFAGIPRHSIAYSLGFEEVGDNRHTTFFEMLVDSAKTT